MGTVIHQMDTAMLIHGVAPMPMTIHMWCNPCGCSMCSHMLPAPGMTCQGRPSRNHTSHRYCGMSGCGYHCTWCVWHVPAGTADITYVQWTCRKEYQLSTHLPPGELVVRCGGAVLTTCTYGVCRHCAIIDVQCHATPSLLMLCHYM